MSRTLAFILLAACVCVADAQPLELYTGEVQVQSKGEAERQQAVPTALINVLQKLSGQGELPPSPQLDAALAAAERIVLAFFYDQRQRLNPESERVEETWLMVRFEPGAVNRIVLDLGLPRWRTDRSPVAVWVAVDDGYGRSLMPEEYEHSWDTMRRIARHRGLPLVWPDTDSASAPDFDVGLLWGGFTDQLPRPAEATGGVVAVAARRVAAEWDLQWTYDDGAETVAWRTKDGMLSSALAQGVRELVDRVAERHSVRGGPSGDWRLRISVAGLGGPEAYARCLGYLERLTVVDGVAVAAARPGRVDFALSLNAEPGYVLQLLERDGVLLPGNRPQEFRLPP